MREVNHRKQVCSLERNVSQCRMLLLLAFESLQVLLHHNYNYKATCSSRELNDSIFDG